ncbi:MAG: molybdopterin converting factor subunit 1 [Gammaproteobacteria bacterium]
MTIQVRFFARLREQIGVAERQLDAAAVATVAQAWQQATGLNERPANVLMAVNMQYVDADAAVVDGDEVAFFPPVTGG